MRKKFFKRLLAASIALGSFTFTPNFYDFNFMSIAYAQIITFEVKGEYIGSLKETPEFAEKSATEYALRDAQEQAGFTLKNFSEMKNGNLKDEISVVSQNFMNIVDKKVEKIDLSGEAEGYTKYRVTLKVNVYTDELENELDKFSKRDEAEKNELIEKNKLLQKMLDDANKRNTELEKLIANAKTAEDKEKIEDTAAMVVNDAQVIEKFAESNKFSYEKNYDKAIESYSEAVKTKIYEVEGIGEVIIDPYNTPLSLAKERARERALRSAIEKIGVIVKSENNSLVGYTIDKNMLEIINTKSVLIAKDNFIILKLIIKARINPDEVDKWVANMKKDVQ